MPRRILFALLFLIPITLSAQHLHAQENRNTHLQITKEKKQKLEYYGGWIMAADLITLITLLEDRPQEERLAIGALSYVFLPAAFHSESGNYIGAILSVGLRIGIPLTYHLRSPKGSCKDQYCAPWSPSLMLSGMLLAMVIDYFVLSYRWINVPNKSKSKSKSKSKPKPKPKGLIHWNDVGLTPDIVINSNGNTIWGISGNF